ncbi:MAG: hypothetical protein WBD28_12245 [Candidatus Zixiibacteriota bacterium]
MKSRVSFLISLSIFYISSFAILILVSHAQTDIPELANAQELIKKAFPNSKITWSKEIQGEMVNFRATPTALAIMIGNGDKKKIKYVNFKDSSEWSIDCHNKSCLYYDIIGEYDPKLWIRGLKDRMPYTRVINYKGDEIINMKLKSWLNPSPFAKYYYTSDNPDIYNQLKVYDTNGKFLWIRKTPGLKVWFVHALSDSELIYVDYQGCFLLDAFTGQKIYKIQREKYGHISGFFKISTALNGEYFTITDADNIASIDNDGKVLWIKENEEEILATALSEDGKFVATYNGKSRAKDGKRLQFFDNFNNGMLIWVSPIKTPIHDIPSDIHGLKIKHNVVYLTPGMVPYYTSKGITPEMQTFYFDIDPEKGTLLDQRIAEGVAETFQYSGKVLSYILIDKDTHKEIFRIEQDKIK